MKWAEKHFCWQFYTASSLLVSLSLFLDLCFYSVRFATTSGSKPVGGMDYLWLWDIPSWVEPGQGAAVSSVNLWAQTLANVPAPMCARPDLVSHQQDTRGASHPYLCPSMAWAPGWWPGSASFPSWNPVPESIFLSFSSFLLPPCMKPCQQDPIGSLLRSCGWVASPQPPLWRRAWAFSNQALSWKATFPINSTTKMKERIFASPSQCPGCKGWKIH